MSAFKNILVALDLSDLDDTLITYANYMAKHFEIEKIYFVHNIKKYEISDIIEQEIKDVDLEKIITEELNEKVSGLMDAEVDWDVLISDDPYTESLISYICNKYAITTVLLGNKNGEYGSGLVGFKLLRILKCNLLWVPKMDVPEINTVWVSTDLSVASRKSFKVSQVIQNKLPQAEVTALHVYNTPLHFSPYINSSKIETKIATHMERKFSQYLKKLNYSAPLKSLLIAGKEANAASKIRNEARTNKVSFLIVADKGANTFSNLMVGSVTENLFNRDLAMPLFIVKTQY